MLRGLFSVPLKKSKEHKNMEFLTGAVQKEDLGIAEILAGDYEGKNIKVKGAIHTIRDMGEVAFIVLRRRDGLIQCVYEPGKSQFSVDDLRKQIPWRYAAHTRVMTVLQTASSFVLTLSQFYLSRRSLCRFRSTNGN